MKISMKCVNIINNPKLNNKMYFCKEITFSKKCKNYKKKIRRKNKNFEELRKNDIKSEIKEKSVN